MLYSILTWNKPDMVLQRTILPASYGIWGRQKCLGPCSQAFQFVAMGEMDNVMHVQATDSKSKRAFVVCFLTCSRSFRKSLVHGRLFRRKLLYFEVDRINLRAGRNVASVEDQPETPVSEDGSPNAHHHPEKSLITGSLLELEDPVRKNDFGTSSQAVAQNLKETKAKPGRVMLISPWTDRVTPRARGVILMNILTFLYGSNIAVVKEAQELLSPAAFAAGRFAVASLFFFPVGWGAWKDDEVRSAGLELGVWAAVGYLTQSLGVLTTDAARASFISTFTVIVVPLLAGLFGAKISKNTWLAVIAALVGVGLLESGGTPPTVGDLYTFISAVVFGVHILRTEHHSKSLKRENSSALIALQLMTTAIISCIWLACDIMSSDKHMDVFSTSWAGIWNSVRDAPVLLIIYTGLFTTALCLYLELVSMREVSATEAAVIYTLEPLWGAAFAWFLLGERWGPNGWLGATFIIGGSLMVQLFGTAPQQSPKQKSKKLPDSSE